MKPLGNVHKYVSRMLALQNFCLNKEIYIFCVSCISRSHPVWMEGSREWSLEVWVLEHTLSLITWATCIEDNPSCTSSVHKLILKDWTRWFYVIFGYTVLQPNRHTLFHLYSGPLGDLGFHLSHNKRKVM